MLSLWENFKKYDNDILPVSGNLDPDIMSISHILSLEMIKVTLNKDWTCLKPFLREQLAGPTIAIIEWDKVELGKNEISGYYKVPYTRRYFLKIIALLCNELQFHQDFSATCLEELINHRITIDNPVIIVENIDKSYENTEEMGSWVFTGHENETRQPLYTMIMPSLYYATPPPPRGLAWKITDLWKIFRHREICTLSLSME